ncbi:MAG: presqualene diphosphate synthase HpnD [Rhodospirillales bacterium]
MTETPPPAAPSGAPALSAADADALARAVKDAGTSFYWAMRMQPAAKRGALYAVYAFCRAVDDIADEPGEADAKRRALEGWRAEVRMSVQGRPATLIGRGLASAHARFGLDPADLLAVIDGMETDAAPRVRILNDAELMLYVDRAACAVGRLCVRVFGLPEAAGKDLAKAQGEALQLTNILRDVAEDAARDRIYLPVNLLARHGVPADITPEALLDHPGLRPACRELAARAGAGFAEAGRLIKAQPRRLTRPSRMMLAVYRAAFDLLAQADWADVRNPPRPGKRAKALTALRHGLF